MSVRELTKKILKSNAFGRIIYKPLHKCWRLYNEPHRRKKLRKYGIETMAVLHNFFEDNNIEYYIDFGTLLGIVRENGFIKHDDDIDLTIRYSTLNPKQIIKKLEELGFSFVQGFHAQNETTEFTLKRKGLTVDFFLAKKSDTDELKEYIIYSCFYNPKTEYPNVKSNNYRAWKFPLEIKSKIIDFKGIHICIPDQDEKLLIAEYGQNWKTPDKNFVEDPSICKFEIQEGFAVRETDYKYLP